MSESALDFHKRQVATSEASVAARLDEATEERLYRLYRAFFQQAEQERNWNVWEDLPWDAVRTGPSEELVAEVLDVYKEGAFLPDYTDESLKALRSSRGRAWFLTRWSYEEGKRQIGLTEWLTRSGAYTDEQLGAITEELLTNYRWEPPFRDAPALFADALLWEQREIRHAEELRTLARQADDPALVALLEMLLRDDRAHWAFFRDALAIIAETYPEMVEDAAHRAAGEVGYAPSLLLAAIRGEQEPAEIRG